MPSIISSDTPARRLAKNLSDNQPVANAPAMPKMSNAVAYRLARALVRP